MARKAGRTSGGPYEGQNSLLHTRHHVPQVEADRAAAKQYGRSFRRSKDWNHISLDEVLGTNQPTIADLRGAAKRARQASNPASWRARQLSSEQTQEAVELAKGGDDSLLLPYHPTSTIDPNRPRTDSAGYDAETKTLRVRFDRPTKSNPSGAWEYYNVPPQVWKNFQRVKSPGRLINSALNHYNNAPGDF